MGVTRATKQAPPRQGRSVSLQRTDVTMRPDLFQLLMIPFILVLIFLVLLTMIPVLVILMPS